jgi:Cu/Ag efflux pump CusA
MLGGVITSFLLELLVYPAIYSLWRMRSVTTEKESDF